MKINKDSWHYKFLKNWSAEVTWDINQRVSLCKYFWSLAGHIGLSVGLVMLGILCAVGAGGFVYGNYLAIIGQEDGTMFLVFWTAVLIIFTGSRIVRDVKNRSSVKEKEPSILREYVKAKKQKWCPTVEFVEGKR